MLVQDYHFALLPAMIRAAAAARDDPDLLAHPVAEPRVVRHLPVAARDPRRACWAARSSASTRASTARTSSRRSTASSRRASSTSTRRSRSSGDETLIESYPISIEWPVGGAARQLAAGRRVPAPRVRAPGAAGRRLPRGRRRPLRLHQGHPRAAARGRAPAREAPRVDRPVRPSCRWPRRRAARSRSTAPSRSASSASPSASTSASAAPGYQPVHLLAEHHDQRRRHRAVPRRRHLRGHQPARRHEPGLQGVRRRARRRAGRAGPEPLRRRRARD